MADVVVRTLSDNDIEILRGLIRAAGNHRLNTSNRPFTDVADLPAPEVYVVYTPEGGIPAQSRLVTLNEYAGTGTPGTGTTGSDVLGYATCQVYQGLISGNIPTLQAVDSFYQIVYNDTGRPVTAGVWATVVRDKYGFWYVTEGGNSWVQEDAQYAVPSSEDNTAYLDWDGGQAEARGPMILKINADTSSYDEIVSMQPTIDSWPILLWNTGTTVIVLDHDDGRGSPNCRFCFAEGEVSQALGTTTVDSPIVTGLPVGSTDFLTVGDSVTSDNTPTGYEGSTTQILTVDSSSQITLTAPATIAGQVLFTFIGYGNAYLLPGNKWQWLNYDFTLQRWRQLDLNDKSWYGCSGSNNTFLIGDTNDWAPDPRYSYHPTVQYITTGDGGTGTSSGITTQIQLTGIQAPLYSNYPVQGDGQNTPAFPTFPLILINANGSGSNNDLFLSAYSGAFAVTGNDPRSADGDQINLGQQGIGSYQEFVGSIVEGSNEVAAIFGSGVFGGPGPFVGQVVVGEGIPPSTYITSLNYTAHSSFTISNPATATNAVANLTVLQTLWVYPGDWLILTYETGQFSGGGGIWQVYQKPNNLRLVARGSSQVLGNLTIQGGNVQNLLLNEPFYIVDTYAGDPGDTTGYNTIQDAQCIGAYNITDVALCLRYATRSQVGMIGGGFWCPGGFQELQGPFNVYDGIDSIVGLPTPVPISSSALNINSSVVFWDYLDLTESEIGGLPFACVGYGAGADAGTGTGTVSGGGQADRTWSWQCTDCDLLLQTLQYHSITQGSIQFLTWGGASLILYIDNGEGSTSVAFAAGGASCELASGVLDLESGVYSINGSPGVSGANANGDIFQGGILIELGAGTGTGGGGGGTAWSSITGTPTTVAGYGITDAITTTTTAGGDVSGTFGALVVSDLQGVPLVSVSATAGDLLVSTGSGISSLPMSGDATIDGTGKLTTVGMTGSI